MLFSIIRVLSGHSCHCRQRICPFQRTCSQYAHFSGFFSFFLDFASKLFKCLVARDANLAQLCVNKNRYIMNEQLRDFPCAVLSLITKTSLKCILISKSHLPMPLDSAIFSIRTESWAGCCGYLQSCAHRKCQGWLLTEWNGNKLKLSNMVASLLSV